MRKILLVNPEVSPAGVKESILSKRSLAETLSPLQAGIVPLGLVTIAALTPNDIEVDIWDEPIDGRIHKNTSFGKEYDLVGVTGYVNHASRVNALGHIFHERNILTAIGGSGVSSEPERYRNQFDILFIGEAEYTWPRFIADWKVGSFRSLYRQVEKVDMAHTPPPRWDSLSIGSYLMGALQTTRGCPFDCEFCDVIHILGRQPRHKSIGQVLEEVRALEQHRVKRIFFCDDNLISNPRYAKELVKALIPLNRSFNQPLWFVAQVSLNVANDDELLTLLADANFVGFYIGIESPNIESLMEANKPQNYRTDILAAVKKIHSYGFVIQSGLIVGFDHDAISIFNQHFEFLQKSGIPIPMINLLKAPTGTKIWARLHKEDRVLDAPSLRNTNNLESLTNIIPKQMTNIELLSGYIDLIERVRDWRNFDTRVRVMISQVKRQPNIKRRGTWKEILVFALLLLKMDMEARETTLRLLFYTFRRAPFMVPTIVGTISFQFLEWLRVPYLKESVSEQIQIMIDERKSFKLEKTMFFIPIGFKKSYDDIFPELHMRIYQGLFDKSRTNDVLVEVTCKFLSRRGLGFKQLEKHHSMELYELCDRAIATENRELQSSIEQTRIAELPVGKIEPEENHSTFWYKQLSEDVLHYVEQDLRSFHPSLQRSELKSDFVR